jgi:hypothetical protein
MVNDVSDTLSLRGAFAGFTQTKEEIIAQKRADLKSRLETYLCDSEFANRAEAVKQELINTPLPAAPSEESIALAWMRNTGIKDRYKAVKGESSPQELVASMIPNSGIIRGVVDLGDGCFRIYGFGIANSADKKCPIKIPAEVMEKLSALTDEQYAEQAGDLLQACEGDRAYAFSSFYQDYALDYTPDGRGGFTVTDAPSAARTISAINIPQNTEEGRNVMSLLSRAAAYLGSR